MTTMNVSLPDTLRDYIEQQVKIGGYGSSSEYIRDLIRQDQKRKAQEHLQTLLLEGLDSGEALPMSDRDWTEIRQAVQEKLQQQHG
ncbi:MAG: type II toxin-antitoxin system ParD family antitoxin [Coleofasciculaceae cyanobacterium SM2_1_6]|nr:type II toxin-antitoxin system ParD family antitoxin [Coleofasciculaceae cyanobacterium SM2_1_6]